MDDSIFDAASIDQCYSSFYSIPINEKEIKHILQQEVNWRLPEKDHLHAHHDCLFHDSITYFTRSAVKTSITTGEICVDVREFAHCLIESNRRENTG